MKDHSPAAVLGSPAALGTAAAGVDILVVEGVPGKHPVVGHIVNFLLRSNVVRNPHKAYRSLVQDTTVADNRNHYDPVEVVYREESVSDPSYDCLG